MNRTELINWLAKVSFRGGANTFQGRDTLEKWAAHYDTFSTKELQAEYTSYCC